MKMSSIARPGSVGNKSLLSKYGGKTGSGPAARNCYASGGAVTAPKAFADGGNVDGDSAPKRLDRPGRKMKGKGKKDAKTNINVVVMAGKGDQPAVEAPPTAMAPPRPMPGPPPGPPPGGPMGPPMGMRKNGGRIAAFKKGGRVKKADGGDIKDPDDMPRSGWGSMGFNSDKAREGRNAARLRAGTEVQRNMREGVDKIKAGSDENSSIATNRGLFPTGFKKGGKAVKRASGGVVNMDAGAGGAKGRLEKMKAYGKSGGGKC